MLLLQDDFECSQILRTTDFCVSPCFEYDYTANQAQLQEIN